LGRVLDGFENLRGDFLNVCQGSPVKGKDICLFCDFMITHGSHNRIGDNFRRRCQIGFFRCGFDTELSLLVPPGKLHLFDKQTGNRIG
jgi:hypothetical protein